MLSKAILENAFGHYRCQIVTVFPYPDRAQDQDWAAEAWAIACQAKSVQIEFDEDVYKLVRALLFHRYSLM